MIASGIVTFNPDLNRLNDNINAIRPQIDKLVVVDNGSQNVNKIIELCKSESIDLILNKKNMGIAYALNRICQYATENDCEWFLTLDQDSIVNENLISQYSNFFAEKNVCIMSCIIKDRNSDIYDIFDTEFRDIKICITSGSLCHTKLVNSINRFDDSLFIDLVDLDICERIKKSNLRIIQINYVGLLHEMGRAQNVRVMGKVVTLYNESSFRLKYIGRNSVLLFKKYKNPMYIKLLLVNFLKIMFLEANKIERISAYLRGVFLGIQGSNGEI